MSAAARRAPAGASGTPSLALGFLAALPLFLAYELGLLALRGAGARASAEQVVARVLFLFGGEIQVARAALLAGAAALAYARLRRAGEPGGIALARRLARLVGEGLLAGVVLGPLLALLQQWLAAEPLAGAPSEPRSLASALRLAGAAPWEELLFRVGLYGGLFLLVRRVSQFLGLETRVAQLGAEWAALVGSALLFACFHLAAVQGLLGAGGEPFHRGAFVWRVSAGILLAGLFRWRGFGVVAWAHALFNLGIALGIEA